MWRALFIACGAALFATSLWACEAVTDGRGLQGRIAEADFSNRDGGGRHENWAPRGARLILHAGFETETEEYDHHILGAARDTKVLTIHVRQPGARRITCPTGVVLPEGQVFEDIAPRLADLDGDGLPEVIVVQTDIARGARLAVYDRRARLRAATPFIGQTHRWLAPIGAADLDGDGRVEIAYIDRPHLARTLRIWRFEKNTLTQVATRAGLTNHQIGWNMIPGGIRTCGGAPEIITADANWSRVMATTFSNGRLTSRALGPYRGPADLTAALACP